MRACELTCIPATLAKLAGSLAELDLSENNRLQLSAACTATVLGLHRQRRLALIKEDTDENLQPQLGQARVAATNLSIHVYLHCLSCPKWLAVSTRCTRPQYHFCTYYFRDTTQAVMEHLGFAPVLWTSRSRQRLVMPPSAFMAANGTALDLAVSYYHYEEEDDKGDGEDDNMDDEEQEQDEHDEGGAG
jgi:hypothetical protein